MNRKMLIALIVVGGLIFVCVVCGLIGLFAAGEDGEPELVGEAPQQAEVVQSTNTPESNVISETPTPSPTNTPRPTFTPEPTLPPQPTSTPLALGQPASFADWDYAVTEVFVMDTVGEQVARGMYIIALVQVTNNAATERELGQFFVAKDSRGRLYEMDTETSLEYHHAFDTATWYLEDIAPAASGVIPVAFDVSPDAAGVILLAAGTNEPAIFLAEDLGGEKPVLPGEPVLEAADWSFIVTEAKTTTSIGDATPRGQYVVIIIKARNDGLTPREIDSFFTLKDAQGRLYEMDTDASLEYHHTFDTDAWHLEALGPSLIGTIPIVFDVSPDATQLRLQTNQGSLETPPLLDAVGGEPIQLSGEVYRNDNWEFVIKETSNATSIGDEISEGQFLIVLLQIKNLGLSQQSLEQLFTLKDAQGRFYEMDTDASLEYHHTFDTDAWYLEDIGPSLTGNVPVVFDVVIDASEFALVTRDGSEIPLQ